MNRIPGDYAEALADRVRAFTFCVLKLGQDVGERMGRREDVFAERGQLHGADSLCSVEELCSEIPLKPVDLPDEVVRGQADALGC